MRNKITDLNHYEILELSRQATGREIEQAYERARATYSQDSIAIYSLMSESEIETIRQQIEEAYRTLSREQSRNEYDQFLFGQEEDGEEAADRQQNPAEDEQFQTRAEQSWEEQMTEEPLESPSPGARPSNAGPELQMPDKLEPPPAEISAFTGPVLQELRVKKDLTIKDVAGLTNVSTRYLEYIEEEDFPRLPARVYLRGYLDLYARALGYEPDRMVGDYLSRYDAANENSNDFTKTRWWKLLKG